MTHPRVGYGRHPFSLQIKKNVTILYQGFMVAVPDLERIIFIVDLI